MKIAVIGAGIVGVSSANWLTKYGQEVTLYDRTIFFNGMHCLCIGNFQHHFL